MNNINISCFTKITDATLKETSWHDVTALIKNDKRLAELTSRLRQSVITNNWDLKNPEHKRAYQNLKAQLLPGFLPGGTFLSTNKEDLTSYSSVVHVDFDDLTSSQESQLLQFAATEESILLCFRSPGGRGLKIFHKVTLSEPLIDVDYEIIQSFHTHVFRFLKNLYNSKGLLFLGFDDSVSNINRACYLSSDPNVFIREDVKPIIFDSEYQKIKKKEDEAKEKQNQREAIEDWYLPQVQKYISLNAGEADEQIEKVIEWLQKNNRSITTEYSKWIRVIFALKANFSDEKAEKYARELSKLDASFTEKEFIKKFNQHIKPDKAPSLGTIFYYAKELGYEPTGSLKKLDFFGSFIKALAEHGWKIRYNTMISRLEKLGDGIWVPLYDMDVDEIKVGVFNHRIHRESMRETLNVVAPKYNPADQLKNQIPAWDGKDHIEELLQALHCKETKWPRIFLTRWLIGMLAGITRPDCYSEAILILHGAQGVGKTRIVRRLFTEAFSSFGLEPERYFKQKQIDPGNKDDLLLLCTSFVVFFDEMSSIVNNRADIETFKNMTSATTQTIRKPYGRESEDFRRYASIIGSVNEEQFLVDSTGNRRFWIISVGDINQNHSVNSSQVFAQAMHLLNQGHPHYLSTDEIKELNETYLTRYEIVKAEEELIRTHVVESGGGFMTTTMVMKEINDLYGKDMIKCGAANFGRLLKKYFGHLYTATSKGRFYRVAVMNAGVRRITDTIGVGINEPFDPPILTDDQQASVVHNNRVSDSFLGDSENTGTEKPEQSEEGKE